MIKNFIETLIGLALLSFVTKLLVRFIINQIPKPIRYVLNKLGKVIYKLGKLLVNTTTDFLLAEYKSYRKSKTVRISRKVSNGTENIIYLNKR